MLTSCPPAAQRARRAWAGLASGSEIRELGSAPSPLCLHSTSCCVNILRAGAASLPGLSQCHRGTCSQHGPGPAWVLSQSLEEVWGSLCLVGAANPTPLQMVGGPRHKGRGVLQQESQLPVCGGSSETVEDLGHE